MDQAGGPESTEDQNKDFVIKNPRLANQGKAGIFLRIAVSNAISTSRSAP